MGPFVVQEDGRLTLRDPAQPPGFRFVWQSCAVRVGLREDRLILRALVGHVPSMVASSVQLRQAVFDMLRALVDGLPEGWRMRLLPDHTVAFDIEDVLSAPPTASELLTRLTLFVLALQPYLDFATEAGLEPTAPGAAGTAKT